MSRGLRGVVGLAAMALLAGAARGALAPLDGTVLRTLPNGLRIVVRERHAAPLVAVDAWVRAGSGAERADESGAAHFLEHLIFKGTTTRRPGEIDAAIEDLGASLNAGTLRDGAHFHTTVASAYLGDALGVLADALEHASLPAEEFDRERAVILDEVARAESDLQHRALDALFAVGLAGHPYGPPITGDPASLRTLNRDTVERFYRRLYRPDNTTIVLVGDVSADSAESVVRQAFGSWAADPSAPAPREAQAPEATPDRPAPRAVALQSAGGRAAIALGFPVGPGGGPGESCAADVLAALLGDGRTGRLAARLVDRGLASEAEADYTSLRGPGLFTIYVACDAAHLEAARAAILDEVARVRETTPDAGEVDFARRRVLGQVLASAETYAGQARLLGMAEMMGNYRTAITYPDDLSQVGPAAVHAYARKVLDPARMVVVTAGPAEAAR